MVALVLRMIAPALPILDCKGTRIMMFHRSDFYSMPGCGSSFKAARCGHFLHPHLVYGTAGLAGKVALEETP